MPCPKKLFIYFIFLAQNNNAPQIPSLNFHLYFSTLSFYFEILIKLFSKNFLFFILLTF